MLLLALTAALLACGKSRDDHIAERGVEVGNTERRYHLHTADGSDAKRLPLVVVLHGSGSSGQTLGQTYGFAPMVRRRELIAAYPDAVDGNWRATDSDVRFIDAVIDDVLKHERVDPARLFVVGASSGGMMVFHWLPRTKHRIRGAGTVIAGMPRRVAARFALKHPVDVMMINGTEDPLIPYGGGWGAPGEPRNSGPRSAELLPVEHVAQRIASENGIEAKPRALGVPDTAPDDGCTANVIRWHGAKARVSLIRVQGGGHVPPGGSQYLPIEKIGRACRDFHHAEAMWAFFQSAR